MSDGCRDDIEKVKHQLDELKTWMANGFTQRVGDIIATKLTEQAERQWEREMQERQLQLEVQKEENREYGARRDAELQQIEKRRERRAKVLVTLVGAMAGIIGAAATFVALFR